MRPLEWPLLADENIHPDVVAYLRERGRDIRTVHEEGIAGATDASVLRRARGQGRVVLTHDRDFGTLALHAGEAHVGIVYLRPGHIAAEFTLKTITAIESTVGDVASPFIVVAERRADLVKIRVRSMAG